MVTGITVPVQPGMHDGSIATGPRLAEPMGATNDRQLESHSSPGGICDGFRYFRVRSELDRKLRLHRRAGADVHGRCIPLLQHGNSQHSGRDGLHSQAPHRAERRLPGGDGQGFGQEIEQGRRDTVIAKGRRDAQCGEHPCLVPVLEGTLMRIAARIRVH